MFLVGVCSWLYCLLSNTGVFIHSSSACCKQECVLLLARKYVYVSMSVLLLARFCVVNNKIVNSCLECVVRRSGCCCKQVCVLLAEVNV